MGRIGEVRQQKPWQRFYQEKAGAFLNNSPSGSLCPCYYNNGELHPLKCGSYFSDKQKLFAVIKAEEAFVLVFAGQNYRRIWVNLYQTKVDAEVVAVLAAHVAAIHCKIYKRCFVGCPRRHVAGCGVRLYKTCRVLRCRFVFLRPPKKQNNGSWHNRSDTTAHRRQGTIKPPAQGWAGGRANK